MNLGKFVAKFGIVRLNVGSLVVKPNTKIISKSLCQFNASMHD